MFIDNIGNLKWLFSWFETLSLKRKRNLIFLRFIHLCEQTGIGRFSIRYCSNFAWLIGFLCYFFSRKESSLERVKSYRLKTLPV